MAAYDMNGPQHRIVATKIVFWFLVIVKIVYISFKWDRSFEKGVFEYVLQTINPQSAQL